MLGSSASLGQAGHAGREKSLRGLKGVRLVVGFARAGAIAEAERPALLKLVEGDAAAKLQKAGTPLLRFADEVDAAVSLNSSSLGVGGNGHDGVGCIALSGGALSE